MKKIIRFFSSIMILLFISFGCNDSKDSGVSTSPASATETSFNFTLVSYKKQETGSSVLGRLASFSADQVMTGQLTATNTATLAVQTFDWSIYFDETTWEVQSNKTIILAPGTFDFALLLTKGDQQYAGSVAGQVISDGTFDVPMIIRPIIGNTVTDVSLIISLADFKFNYDADELAAASLVNPQLGVVLDSGTEVVFAINSTTGISDNYINLTAGSYSIKLKLYDGSLQRGRSIAAQETVIVSAGLNITMDLVALHGETTFDLTEAGGDATFSFNIPAEVVDESGGLANLEVLFSMAGSKNPLEENVLSLEPDGSGDYEASITLTNKQFDEVTLSLSFTDTSVGELLGSCTMITSLDTTQRTTTCDVTLIRRAIIGGALLATLGINVFDEAGQPVVGANVFSDQQVIGLTGSGAFGTEGYLKAYLPAGSHHLKAMNINKYGIVDIASTALGIQNVDINLNTPFNEGIEIINGTMSITRDFQFPTDAPERKYRGLNTSQTLITQLSTEVTVDQFSATGTRTAARLHLIYIPDGYAPDAHITGVSIELRAEDSNLFQIAYVFHCVDANCLDAEGQNPISGDFQLGMPIATGVPHTLSIEYLGDGHSFQISVDGQTGILDAANLANFSYFNPADGNFGKIDIRLDDLGPLGDYGSMTASYDNVYVNNVLYDDFSDINTSMTKWNNWR